MRDIVTTGIIILFTGGGLVGTVFYLKGVVSGIGKELLRQNGADVRLLAKVEGKVDTNTYVRDQDKLDTRLGNIDNGIANITTYLMEHHG